MKINEIISSLTIEEKVNLVSGTNFMYTNAIKRLNIPSLRTSDGPHGLRVQNNNGDNGVTGSEMATAFPTAACSACGWNKTNLFKMGQAIGKEAHKYGVNIVLGPGVNIKRNPLGGRNFEYFSEDPILSGELGKAEIEGIQSQEVGVSVKHFALNNSENYRFMGNSIADIRAIREIYLKPFEKIVKEAHPATIMCAYNKINNVYCSQNKWLLTDVLRDEWKFDGLVMTDWGAMHDRVNSLKAGLDLEMPGDTDICKKWIMDALNNGTLTINELNNNVEHILKVIEKYAKDNFQDIDFELHNQISCDIAEDCAVLLKNNNILPLDNKKNILICGDLFEKMRYQGAGSSMINPSQIISPKIAFDNNNIHYTFARGYQENQDKPNQKLIDSAINLAKEHDTILVFMGLTDYVESEGVDRDTMKLPKNQLSLLNALITTNKKIIVVLFGGSPIEIPFANDVDAILNMYLPGQCGGKACFNLLYGKTNPSGRLAETWPLKYEDVPFHQEYSQSIDELYKESIFVGYRYYLTANKPVRYPFGYGLSYTSFEYKNFNITSFKDNNITFSIQVKNTGNYYGGEVIQLYVQGPKTNIFKALRELKTFEKVYLKPNEEKTIKLTINQDILKYFDIKDNEWVLEQGEYEFQICKNCQEVLLSKKLIIDGKNNNPYSNEILNIYQNAQLDKVDNKLFEKLTNYKFKQNSKKQFISIESRFTELQKTFIGRILYKSVLNVAKKQMKEAKKMPEGIEKDNKIKGALFLKHILESNSIITMSMSAGKTFPYNFAEGFVNLANGHVIKGIKNFITPIKIPKYHKKEEK